MKLFPIPLGLIVQVGMVANRWILRWSGCFRLNWCDCHKHKRGTIPSDRKRSSYAPKTIRHGAWLRREQSNSRHKQQVRANRPTQRTGLLILDVGIEEINWAGSCNKTSNREQLASWSHYHRHQSMVALASSMDLLNPIPSNKLPETTSAMVRTIKSLIVEVIKRLLQDRISPVWELC